MDSPNRKRPQQVTTKSCGAPQSGSKRATIDDRGLRCPRCGGGKFRVIYTRAARGGWIIRRRQCQTCDLRVSTVETRVG